MKRVFIIAPNIGHHMGIGGGVRVAIAMAKIFEDLGMQPYLVALRGYDIDRLSEIHGVRLKESKPLYLIGFGPPLRIPFPMQIKLLISFLRREIMLRRPEILVFHDDIPKFLDGCASNFQVVLYSHFPYGARVKFNVAEAGELLELRHRLDAIYRKMLRELIFVDYIPENTLLIANSTITKLFMEKLWKRDVRIVYPPFVPPQLDVKKLLRQHGGKLPYVLTLATIGPNKRIGDVIRAFKSTRNARSKLIIMGHRSSKKYMEYLLKLIHLSGLNNRIRFVLDASENKKWFTLLRAKAIVSAAHFEPFGINVVEGMYAGCIPIVYRSALSGPWIDIINKGKHGLGFKYIEELAELLDDVLDGYDDFAQKFRVEEKAEEFSFEHFKESFIKLLK